MRLVDDDRELPSAVLAPDLVEDERELLHRGDYDLLPLGDKLPQVARVVGMSNCGAHLRELLDDVLDLLVQDLAIRDDDDGVEDRRLVLLEADELVREPGDR